MKVLIYALGGGRGHVQRQLALGTRLVKLGAERVTLLSSSEWYAGGAQSFQNHWTDSGGVSRSEFSGVEVISIPHNWSASYLIQFLITFIYRNSWDWFVVDVFPRGILGELECVLSGGKSRFKTALVQRIFNTNYLRFLNDYCTWPVYDVSFFPGEKSGLEGLSEISIHTKPWIFRSFDEMKIHHSIGDTKQKKAGNPGKLLLVAAGSSEESEFWRNLYTYLAGNPLLENWHIEFVGSQSDGFHSASWPLIDRLPVYDLVIGAGGYNLVHECCLLNVPLIAWPLKRKYDDQTIRLDQNEILKFKSKPALVEYVSQFNFIQNCTHLDSYENGADLAAEFLLNQ